MVRPILAVLALALASGLAAQEGSPRPREDAQESLPPGVPSMALGKAETQKVQAQLQKLKQDQDKALERQMEECRQNDPEAYKGLQEAATRQEKISKVIVQGQAGELTPEEAERELYPLMKAELRSELGAVKERIARLEKELAFLRKVEKDPDVLVRRRVEELLGRRAVEY